MTVPQRPGATARSPVTARPRIGGGGRWKRSVVVLGGESIAVAVARSLGAAGVTTYALGHRLDPVRYSRYCDTFVDLGSGDGVQDRWLDWLEDGPRGAVVLPCNDDALELLARHGERLEELGYAPAEARGEVLLQMLDKERTYALARELGVPAPRTRLVRRAADIPAATRAIGYPCALKPLRSYLLARHLGAHTKAFVAHEPAALERDLERMLGLGVEVMVTEIVAGEVDECRSYYGYLDQAGEPLLHVTKRKLRQNPPRFGIGCYHVTDWDPEVAETGLRFLQGAGALGLACVELKRDSRDGQLKLIECNHRMTLATELLRVAGVDLPRLLYERALGGSGTPPTSYRTGVRLWYPIEDTRSFLASRRSGELSFFSWARSLLERQHLPVARLYDPMPTLVPQARRLARGLLRRAGSPGARPTARASGGRRLGLGSGARGGDQV